MKRLSVCIAFIFSSLCAFAQTGAVQGFCTQGAVPAVTSGSSSANTLQGVIAGCTVTVYLHGTTTRATIYRDGNNTPLANPFTANLAGATNAGGWLFYAATSQGFDIFGSGGGGNPACTTQPKCYAVSTSIAVAVYPSTAITVVTGVLTAQGTSPVEVNGASGTPASGAVTISCPTCTTGGVTAVTGTPPVASSGGATPAISMHVADTSDNGYLSSTDWNTFNGKQPALSLLEGTYVDGDTCTYASSGTLLNCNTSPSGAAFYQTVQANGSSKPQEAKLNLISGANSTVSCADNPGATSTDCTVSSTGGGSVNVNGSSVSSPNFNSSLPAPSAALYAPTPYQVSGSNVIATYPGNPPNTLYVFAGNSINGDDHQVLGPLITVTTWTANGTTCSFNNSGTNGLVAGEWIATNNVTGWPSPPYGPGVGYANGYTNFQISSSGLTSSTFTFACPLISATSGSGGNVEPSGAWLPYQTDSLLPSGEQGTVILRTADPGTIVFTATNYSSLYHSLSPAVTGNPAYLIVNNALNDYISCSSAATIEAAYTSLFEKAHTDGWYVVVGSTTPDALATNGCNTINAIMVATENWLYAQGPTQSNLATGAYWDYFVDVRGVLTNARDSSLMQQNNFTLAPGGAIMMAQMFAQVLHTHQSIFLNKRGDIWAGLPSANSSFNSDNGFAHFLPNVGSSDAESWWDAAYANEYMAADTTNGRMKFPVGAAFGSSNQFIFNASGQPGFTSGCSGQYLKADNTGCGTPSVVPVPTVVDTSTPVTVSATNVSEFHFNENATASTAVTYDLPTAAAGKQFCFSNSYNGSAANTGTLELLTSASGQFIIYTDGTLSATGGFVISTGAAADAACVAGVDSTHWMLYTTRGTWAKH